MLYFIKKYLIYDTIKYFNYSFMNIITITKSIFELFCIHPFIPLLALFYIYSKKYLSNYISNLDKKYDQKDYLYNKYKSNFKSIFKIYNLTMSLFSFYCCYNIYNLVFYELDNYGYALNNYNNSNYDSICYYFFISKYIEYIDTYFLILRNKKVSYLQYIHHIGAPIVTGLLYLTKHPSYHFFVLFNGFIHTIMYLYYYLTLIGYKINFKYILTTLQIIQFNCGIIGGNLYFLFDEIKYNNHLSAVHCISYYYIFIINILFMNFFIKNYIKM